MVYKDIDRKEYDRRIDAVSDRYFRKVFAPFVSDPFEGVFIGVPGIIFSPVAVPVNYLASFFRNSEYYLEWV